MRPVRLVAALAVACLTLPALAAADGAWQTFLRPRTFAPLLAEADTVWCATGEAGLLRYSPATGTVTSYVREPGGLASNRLGALALDRSRRLWVGTLGRGASVLSPDRSSWSLVNAFDGLPSDSVTVLEAQGDSMWIGTSRGLALWDGSQIAGRVPDGINPSKFASDSVTGIAVLGDTLWLATEGGIYRSLLSGGLKDFTRADTGLAGSTVLRLTSDGRDLYALSGNVVHRYDRPSGRWTALAGIGLVLGLSESRHGIFASSDQGLFRRDAGAWVQLNARLIAAGKDRFAVAQDEGGRVYAAGRPASTPAGDESATGLYRQPDSGDSWEFAFPPGPPGNDCLNLDVDGARLYVATTNTGIGRFDGSTWRCWFITPDHPAEIDTTFRDPLFPYAMLVDRSGKKWFGCWAPIQYVGLTTCRVVDAGAIEVMDDHLSVPHFTRYVFGSVTDARRSFARASTLDSSGGHWFGMDSPCGDDPALSPAGLEYYDVGGAYVGNYDTRNTGGGLLSSQIWALAADASGRVWIGSSRGLSYFDNPPLGAGSVVAVQQTDQYAVRGLAVHRDTLWALTSSGVWRYSTSRPGAARVEYTVPAGPAAQAVRPLDVGPDGTLWIGTANGMRAYRPNYPRQDYNTANSPIADDEVRTIRVDRRTGVVWIATAGGVSRFDPAFVPRPAVVPSLAVRVYPNPARLTALGFTLRLSGSATAYRGEIYDLGSRVVHAFTASANGQVIWDGRDASGELVKPGVYFVRAESGGHSVVARVAVVR